MDQESALPSGGSYISLNENEQRYYSGLHTVCQADSSGKLSAGKVGELFKTSQLPPEALHQVTEVCGAKRLGCFGTAQFYVALKLLSAAQCGLPISLESVTANLPLPVFVGFTTEQDLRRGALPQSVDAQQGLPDGAASLPGAWPLAEKRGGLGHPEGNTERKERWPPAQPPGMTPPRSPPLPRNYPHAVARNDMDAHIANESKHSTRPIIQQDLHSSPSNYRTKAAPELSAVSRASVAAVDYSDEDDAWRITAEQREYYTNQFITLQPDLGALVLGTVARNFFTKSKLPIPELSHIWELSDVDRDGALTFSEFCTAFHLIVARKNGYPLPDTLPPTLQPGFIEHDTDFSDTPGTTEPLIVFEDADFSTKQMDRNIVERVKPALPKLKQEIKLESDFSSRRCETSQDKRTEPHQDPDPQLKTRTRPRSYSSTSIDDAMKKAEVPPTPPPRPQKTHSRASSLDLNKLLQQGGPGVKGSWLPPPPALPPRPSASQVPLFISAAEKTPVKKAQQPYFADFSRFREEEEIGPDHRLRSRLDGAAEDLASTSKPDMGVPHHRVPQKPVRRKYHQDGQNPEATPPSTASLAPPTKPAQKLLSKRKREIQMAIRQNKETNAVLTRLNSELQQQLKEVHRERITLESQLELLRPLAST